VIAQQMGCPTCGAMGPDPSSLNGTAAPGFVYAIGRVEARYPNLAAEKEFAQATGRADTAGQTDQQTFHSVLSRRENRYLARQLCWVLTVQGQETYLLTPRDSSDIDLLIEAIRPAPSPNDIDVVSASAARSLRRRCATACSFPLSSSTRSIRSTAPS